MSGLPTCLIGAGVLGHTWAGTRFDGVGGSERLAIQASFGADVVRMLDEHKDAWAGHIYERVGRSKWRKRTRGYALLDQPPGRPYEPAIEEPA